jgi:hypothetical protein
VSSRAQVAAWFAVQHLRHQLNEGSMPNSDCAR